MPDNMENDLGELEFDTPLEEEEALEVSQDKRSIYTNQGDPEIESLYGKRQRGKLIIQPDFQRHFVWDETKSSRLIESALLDIPLPVIYLAEDSAGKEQVIDGQQRLTAFFSFIDGKFPSGKDFKLRNLKVFTEYNKKKFEDLPDEVQDKIRYCKVRTITFLNNSDSDLKFEVFERLNTGSVSLNDQELRNCIYRGAYNTLLKELSEEEDFKYIMELSGPDRRMKDVELVLRFAAFYHATYLNYRSPIRKFLNEDMEKYQHVTDPDAQRLRKVFKNAVSIIRSLFDKQSFKRFYRGHSGRPDGHWETKKFNVSLYDILMYSFADMDKNMVFRHLDAIREEFIDLMTMDDYFIESIEKSTSSKQAVTVRFDKWRLRLQEVAGHGNKEPRLFTYALKRQLFEKDPTCAICGNRISHLDDSAVDHIEQYWRGGRTVPENARLTHRYCNFARSRID